MWGDPRGRWRHGGCCQPVGRWGCCRWRWDAWKAVETGPALCDRLWSVLVRPDPALLVFVVNGTSGAEPHWGRGREKQSAGRGTNVVMARLSLDEREKE